MSGRNSADKKTDRRIAVALEYGGQGAPRVTAKGRGVVADEILNLARDNKVPLQTDGDLVEILSQLELNQEIPENLYRAVAEVIAFAYFIKGKRPGDSVSSTTGPRGRGAAK